MILHLVAHLPPTTNNAYTNGNGHHRRVLTAEARAYKVQTALIARNAAALSGWRYGIGQRLEVLITLHFPDHRRCDLANREKLLIDALSEALGFDDVVIDDLHLVRGAVDRDNPRCVVTIWSRVPADAALAAAGATSGGDGR